eukprot:Protomagalhaensia_wolfi_Nauph_80__3625@NODE_3660_length_742_cov_355_288762_g2882_i0_p2_GENE_NODE_3660_length_742_cov_355_288762_g2882_i0NODE_3660_length_742_cov_355_288762_g2882_i0_p2_ORF_typecomplete_len127_score8_80_NODE_3660_length_742_cov_355_288762_g2882_i0209589
MCKSLRASLGFSSTTPTKSCLKWELSSTWLSVVYEPIVQTSPFKDDSDQQMASSKATLSNMEESNDRGWFMPCWMDLNLNDKGAELAKPILREFKIIRFLFLKNWIWQSLSPITDKLVIDLLMLCP